MILLGFENPMFWYYNFLLIPIIIDDICYIGVIMGVLITPYKFILNRIDGAIFLIVFNNRSWHAKWILEVRLKWM